VSDVSGNSFRVSPQYQPLMRQLGLDAESVFDHPQVKAWRRLPDRQNCTLDYADESGAAQRLHIKRYAAVSKPRTPADEEVRGHRYLAYEKIPTAELVGYGRLADRRSFVIFADLAGFTPADKLIAAGTPFDCLRDVTADLAARLHRTGLHHRDLYLCHFMVKLMEGDSAAAPEVRLIDAARVRPIGNVFTRHRWMIKDLAQFWYSTLQLPIGDDSRTAWLQRYAEQRGLPSPVNLRPPIESKVRRIMRHDAKLNRLHPTRNISIPH
jgi:Lipopolysaccharide kinase (Kdo/WaaP) family